MSGSELEGSAPQQSLCSVSTHAEALLQWTCCTVPGARPVPRMSLPGGTFWWRTGGSSYLTGGECPQARGHTLAHPQQRSVSGTCASHALQWRSQNIFTGVARMRPLLRKGWPTNRSLGFKLLWIYLCFLAVNVFISPATQAQPCHTIKFGYLNQLFMKEMLNDCFDLWNLRGMIFILQIELFYKYLLTRLIPCYRTQTCSSNSKKSFSLVAVLIQT